MSQGRQFLRESLAGLDPTLLDTAELLASEVMTNSVLHARSPFELRVWGDRQRIHVRVTDATPTRRPLPRAQSAESTNGRGLFLVSELAAYYGVDVEPARKAVWFEVWSLLPPPGRDAGWGARPDLPTGEATVLLREVPVGLFRAVQRHREALLREAKLHTLVHGDLFGVPTEELTAAESMHELISAAALPQLDLATEERTDLRLDLPRHVAPEVAHLARVLAVANAAAADGRFLVRPALPEVASLRTWVLTEIAEQLEGGRPPQPWSSPEPAAPLRRTARSAVSLPDLDDATVATVVANDDNVIVAANPGVAALLGWATDALVGQRLITIIPPAWRQRHIAGFTTFLLTGTPTLLGREVTVPALAASGAEVPVMLLIHAQHEADGRTLFVARMRSASDPSGAG